MIGEGSCNVSLIALINPLPGRTMLVTTIFTKVLLYTVIYQIENEMLNVKL